MNQIVYRSYKPYDLVEKEGFEPSLMACKAIVLPDYTKTPNANAGTCTQTACVEGNHASIDTTSAHGAEGES